MNIKSPLIRHRLSKLFRGYQRILVFILVALVTFITTLYVPALSAQRVEGTSKVSSQTSTAQLLLQQGIERYNAERFSEALEIWQQAATAFVSQGDNLNQALVLRYLSLAYQQLGQWQEAKEAITNCLNFLNNQQDLANTQTYLNILAKALNTKGRLQAAIGNWSEALETWKKAAVTYGKGNNQTGVIGSLINQAAALQALGLTSQAKAELSQVEQILQQQSDSHLQATGLQNLGKVLRRIGHFKESQTVLQKSLQVAQDAQLPQAEDTAFLELGNVKRALGNRAIAFAQEEEAKQYLQGAIAFYQQVSNSPTLQLQAQLNLLSLWVETGEGSEVVKLTSTIQDSIDSLPLSRTAIYARLNFAQSLMKRGAKYWGKQPLTRASKRVDENKIIVAGKPVQDNFPSTSLTSSQPLVPNPSAIAQILAPAIQQAQSLNDERVQSYALGQLGELYELTGHGQLSESLELTQQALLLAEDIQAPEIRYLWEWQLGRLWEKLEDKKRAIAAYQEAIRTLKSLRGDLLTINSEVQFSFRDNVEPIHRQLVNLLLRKEGNSKISQENLRQAIEVIDSLQLAELENFLSCNLAQQIQITQSIDTIDQEATFIYPIILEDRLAIIAKFPGQPLNHYVTTVEKTELEKTAIELRFSILKRNRPEVVIEQGTNLYKWLIEPLEQDLENSENIKTLVFVLDGVLRNIPMSVLYDGKRQEYLMQKKYALVLVPGVQLFDLRPLQREQLKVLTAGVSEQRQVEGRMFSQLANVEEELQQIGSIVSSESLLNLEFTETNLQQQISSGNFSTVHIATHGKFSSDPEETFILTYNQLLKSNKLNNLLRNNNRSASGNVELLILSACETAKGDNRATLGLAGIAVRAGARSVLSTLWQVSDRSTAELMGYFYKELTDSDVTKAEALHQAQLALFERYKAPYYWAPYVLVGNWL